MSHPVETIQFELVLEGQSKNMIKLRKNRMMRQ
jgi:hypothetical protein